MSQENDIQSIVVDGDTLNITASDGTKYYATKESNVSIYEISGLPT